MLSSSRESKKKKTPIANIRSRYRADHYLLVLIIIITSIKIFCSFVGKTFAVAEVISSREIIFVFVSMAVARLIAAYIDSLNTRNFLNGKTFAICRRFAWPYRRQKCHTSRIPPRAMTQVTVRHKQRSQM